MVRARIEELPRGKLFIVMRNIAYALNFWGFAQEMLMIDKLGPDIYRDERYIEMASEAARREARGLRESSVISGTGINAVVQAIEYSHWPLFEEIEITRLTQNSIRFRTIRCSAQKFATSRNWECYPCRSVGLSERRGFVEAIDPNARVGCVFCPPDPRPEDASEDVSCEWIVSIGQA